MFKNGCKPPVVGRKWRKAQRKKGQDVKRKIIAFLFRFVQYCTFRVEEPFHCLLLSAVTVSVLGSVAGINEVKWEGLDWRRWTFGWWTCQHMELCVVPVQNTLIYWQRTECRSHGHKHTRGVETSLINAISPLQNDSMFQHKQHSYTCCQAVCSRYLR